MKMVPRLNVVLMMVVIKQVIDEHYLVNLIALGNYLEPLLLICLPYSLLLHIIFNMTAHISKFL